MTEVLIALAVILIAALVLVNLAYIRHLEAKDARHDAQIGRLLIHVQAPEVAVIEHQQAHAGVEDGSPLTDEETAEEQAARLLALKRIDEIDLDFAGRRL